MNGDHFAVPTVTIVIVTRNRRDDVLRAIESCLAQNYEALEVLVYDDASRDGTAAAVREYFPQIRLVAAEDQTGYLVWRNRGFHEARGEFVISIDDDAYFTDSEIVTRVVEMFEEFPQAAAIALPYREPPGDRGSGHMTPLPVGTQLRSYTGCAHALRRDVVLQFGGYREFLVHAGEERDLSVRMLDAGWQVIYADTPPLVHLYSPIRDRDRVNYYGYRNTLLFSGLNVPQPYVLPKMLFDSFQLMRYRFRWRSLPARLQAIAAGWWTCLKYWGERRPVRRSTYKLYRSLPGHGPLASVEGDLPALLTRQAVELCSKS